MRYLRQGTDIKEPRWVWFVRFNPFATASTAAIFACFLLPSRCCSVSKAMIHLSSTQELDVCSKFLKSQHSAKKWTDSYLVGGARFPAHDCFWPLAGPGTFLHLAGTRQYHYLLSCLKVESYIYIEICHELCGPVVLRNQTRSTKNSTQNKEPCYFCLHRAQISDQSMQKTPFFNTIHYHNLLIACKTIRSNHYVLHSVLSSGYDSRSGVE